MGWPALVATRARIRLALMDDAHRNAACALLLTLALIGCDEAGGSDDAPEREDGGSSVAAGDAGAGLDSGATLDARTPTDDGRTTQVVVPASSLRDAATASAEGGSNGEGRPQEGARADGAAEESSHADGAAAQTAADAATAQDAEALDAAHDAHVAPDAQPVDAAAEAGGSDAGVSDASALEGDAAAPACVEQGERCDRASCCTGVCVRAEEGAVCAEACELPTRCEGCGPYCGANRSGATRCDDAVLIAEDGTYLGEAAGSSLERDSVCNETSAYGSSFGRLSIFNVNGMYGNGSGRHSAYNIYSLTPPAIACRDSDDIIAYVSKNSAQARTVVDPDELCAWLRQRGM